MRKSILNDDFSVNTFPNRDVLSVFKKESEKSLTIHQGMSVKEIAEIVSEKVIAVVKEQFKATEEQFNHRETKI